MSRYRLLVLVFTIVFGTIGSALAQVPRNPPPSRPRACRQHGRAVGRVYWQVHSHPRPHAPEHGRGAARHRRYPRAETAVEGRFRRFCGIVPAAGQVVPRVLAGRAEDASERIQRPGRPVRPQCPPQGGSDSHPPTVTGGQQDRLPVVGRRRLVGSRLARKARAQPAATSASDRGLRAGGRQDAATPA